MYLLLKKIAELDAKINWMNDAIASNTVRNTNNSDTIKNITSSITAEDINISRVVRHMNYHVPNIQLCILLILDQAVLQNQLHVL